MANQYTVFNYSKDEINKIVSLYINGMSFTKISLRLGRKKNNIKKILIREGVFVKDRDNVKKKFSDNDINEIIYLYVKKNWGLRKISEKFNLSISPIKRIIKEHNVLRKGYSNGKKNKLSEREKKIIYNLYLNEKKNCKEIEDILGYSCNFISNFLSKNNKLRSRSEATTLYKTGKSPSKEAIENMKEGQRKLVLSGKRKQTGGVCKKYLVNEISCHGISEKKYIEHLINENKNLPENCSYLLTPFGAYYPDFKYDDKYIEIKSTYTYDVLYGLKKSRWTKKYDTTQLKKIKWVNENIMSIELIVVDKNNFISHKI